MSETIPRPPRRMWLLLTAIGCTLIVVAMLVVALVIVDKPDFGWLVGTWFLEVITSGVMVGAILFTVGAWNLPERRSWRGVTLIVWGLVALTSPAFGFLFLLPWSVLVVSLPLIVAILVTRFRAARVAPVPLPSPAA
jgi:hypothetical protein